MDFHPCWHLASFYLCFTFVPSNKTQVVATMTMMLNPGHCPSWPPPNESPLSTTPISNLKKCCDAKKRKYQWGACQRGVLMAVCLGNSPSKHGYGKGLVWACEKCSSINNNYSKMGRHFMQCCYGGTLLVPLESDRVSEQLTDWS